MAKKPNKATFFYVKDNQAKAQYICLQTQQLIFNEKRVLISVPNSEAAKYIDTLLWRYPEDSFLPHSIVAANSKDWVVIVHEAKDNLNQATCLFNLCPSPSPIVHLFDEIYELYDETHPEKALSSQKKLDHYKSLGISVATINGN